MSTNDQVLGAEVHLTTPGTLVLCQLGTGAFPASKLGQCCQPGNWVTETHTESQIFSLLQMTVLLRFLF